MVANGKVDESVDSMEKPRGDRESAWELDKLSTTERPCAHLSWKS